MHLEFRLNVRVSAHLCEVPIDTRVIKVQYIRIVVTEDPWKHRVLVEIVVRATSDGVEIHEVVKVGDFSSLPFGGHRGLAE